MKDISLYASVNNEIRKSTCNFESLLGINLGVRCIFIKTFDKVKNWRRGYANLG